MKTLFVLVLLDNLMRHYWIIADENGRMVNSDEFRDKISLTQAVMV